MKPVTIFILQSRRENLYRRGNFILLHLKLIGLNQGSCTSFFPFPMLVLSCSAYRSETHIMSCDSPYFSRLCFNVSTLACYQNFHVYRTCALQTFLSQITGACLGAELSILSCLLVYSAQELSETSELGTPLKKLSPESSAVNSNLFSWVSYCLFVMYRSI